MLFGLAGAAAISGLVFGALALDSASDLERTCGADRTCDAGSVASMRREAIVSDVSFGTSAALLVAAVVLLVLQPKEPARAIVAAPGLRF